MKWIAQKTIWTLTIVMIGLVTGVLAFRTIEDYSRHPIMANLKVISNNSVSLPNGTLCLPLYLGELNDDQSPNDSYSNNLMAFFNDKLATKEFILDYGQNWTNSFRHVVHAYLIELSKIDYLKANFLQETGTDADIFSAIRILENNLRKLSISVEELRQKFGSEASTFYALSVREYGIDPEDYSNYREIDVSSIKFVGEKQICFHIQLDSILLTQSNEIAIFFSEHSLPKPRVTGMQRDWPFIDLLGRSHMDTALIGMADLIFTSIFGSSVDYEIKAATTYKMLARVANEARCSSDETVDECQANCRTRTIQVVFKRRD